MNENTPAPEKLYIVVDDYDESDYEIIFVTHDGYEVKNRKPIVCPHPAEWEEFCKETGRDPQDFFLPASNRIYRSRSSAIERRDSIIYWGGKAKVLECTPVWEDLETAKKRRERERLEARIAKKETELLKLEDRVRELS